MSRTHPTPEPAGDDQRGTVDPATGREPDDVRNSNDELAGGMGVSSEREGPTGPGQHGTDGVRYTGPTEPAGDVPPEQSAGGVEENRTACRRRRATPGSTRARRTSPTTPAAEPRRCCRGRVEV